MRWNHRVVREILFPGPEVVETFAIHEVYYEDDGTIMGYAEQKSAPFGESLEEVKADYASMQGAFGLAVLDKDILDLMEMNCEGEEDEDVTRHMEEDIDG
jgi:hypothetical protein